MHASFFRTSEVEIPLTHPHNIKSTATSHTTPALSLRTKIMTFPIVDGVNLHQRFSAYATAWNIRQECVLLFFTVWIVIHPTHEHIGSKLTLQFGNDLYVAVGVLWLTQKNSIEVIWLYVHSSRVVVLLRVLLEHHIETTMCKSMLISECEAVL